MGTLQREVWKQCLLKLYEYWPWERKLKDAEASHLGNKAGVDIGRNYRH